MSRPWEQATGVNPWWPKTRYMIGWQFAHTCDADCPYCFMRENMDRLVVDGARWWTDDEAVAAWQNVAETHGPCHVVFSGMEPSEQLPLVGRVLEHHYGAMLTNLTCDLEELVSCAPSDRLIISPSFHPHLWGGEAEPFLNRLADVKSLGYRVSFATVVAWPPYLEDLPRWVADLGRDGLRVVVIPYQGYHHGALYPEGYSAEERDFVYPNASPSVRAPRAGKRIACAAGHACAYVLLSGDVWRCSQMPMPQGQNFFREGNLRFLSEPSPCPQERCPCTQFHQYHIYEGDRDVGMAAS